MAGIDIYTQKVFHQRLYSGAGMLKTVQLLKRGDDQAEGTVTPYLIFECRRSQIFKVGEPIQGDMSASYQTTFHIPRIALDAVGVHYINALDRILERSDTQYELRTWQPESDSQITGKLFEDHVCVACRLLAEVPWGTGNSFPMCPYPTPPPC